MQTFSLFDHTSTPPITNNDDFDNSQVSLGTVFKCSVDAVVPAIWLYVANTELAGQNAPAYLYPYEPPADGTAPPLATVAFTINSSIGWQRIPLTSPVPITANTRYIVAYVLLNSTGHYMHTANVFTTDLVSGNLTGEATATVGNGRYGYNPNTPPSYPDQPSSGFWYGVDVEVEIPPKDLYWDGNNWHTPESKFWNGSSWS